jgi:hypothetical protein
MRFELRLLCIASLLLLLVALFGPKQAIAEVRRSMDGPFTLVSGRNGNVDDGKPVRVRYLWSRITKDSARWGGPFRSTAVGPERPTGSWTCCASASAAPPAPGAHFDFFFAFADACFVSACLGAVSL